MPEYISSDEIVPFREDQPDELQIQLDLVRKTPVKLTGLGGYGLFKVFLPYECYMDGRILVDVTSDQTVARVGEIWVSHWLRRHGIGERLLRSFTAVAKESGSSYITGHVVSPTALRLRERVFGVDNVQIYDTDFPTMELPFTVNEANQVIQRARCGFIVRSYLEEVDTTIGDWELPPEIG